jgi:hypothetical protein
MGTAWAKTIFNIKLLVHIIPYIMVSDVVVIAVIMIINKNQRVRAQM